MKANEAPEKIYINPMPNPSDGYVGVAWSEPHIDMKEYTRTDAFIEKALEFLDGCIPDYIDLTHANVDTFMHVDNKRFIEDFKNYMKGE